MAQSMAKELQSMLEAASDDLKKRYEALVRASDATYANQRRQLDEDYRASALAASADAKIGLKNSLERMADAGYIGGGETVQATIAANTEKNRALTDLAKQRARDQSALAQSHAEKRAAIALEGEKEIAGLKKEAGEVMLEEERNQREWEAQEAQRAFENSVKLKSLSLQQSKSNQTASEAGITPKKDPYTYVDEVVEQYTTYNKKQGKKVVDRRAILLALSGIVQDQKLSYRYRYEMYLYGKTLGYLS